MGGACGQPPPPQMPHPIYGMQMQQPIFPGAGGCGGGRGPPGKGGGRPRPNPGDWNCTNPLCKNHVDNFVYGSKSECPLCGSPKPDDPVTPILPGGGGGGMFPGDKPVFTPREQAGPRPGDWQCPNNLCKNHTNGVYGSKPTCSLCGASKPEDTYRTRSRSPHRG